MCLFFSDRTPASGQTYTLGRTSHQIIVKFLTSLGDCLLVYARYLRQKTISPVADDLRFMGNKPAALLFVHSAQEQIDTLMSSFLRMLNVLLAEFTLADIDIPIWHGFFTVENGVADQSILH